MMQNIVLGITYTGIAVFMAELVYIVLQKPSIFQTILIIMLLSGIVTFVGYIFEIAAKPLEGMSGEEGDRIALEIAYMGAKIGYLGKPFSLLGTLLFFMEYCRVKPKKWVSILLIIFFSLISGVVLTNNHHQLFYSSVSYDALKSGSKLVITHGPLWYAYMGIMFVVFIAYGILSIFEYRHSKTKQAKKMTLYLFLMLASSIIGFVLFVLKLTGGYDTTLLGTLVGAIILFVLLFKYHMFDAIVLAKDSALDEDSDAFIVVDARMNISYYNKLSVELVPGLKDIKIKRNDAAIIQTLNEYDDAGFLFINDRVYRVEIRDLQKNKGGLFIGRTYQLHDITDSYNYAERLKKDVEIKTKEIKEMQRSVMISFANLIEARDGCTGLHIKNTSRYAGLIAMSLKKQEAYKDVLSDEFIQILIDVAPLHDVGKIYIPDRILGKPGKLTSEEFDEMKKHTTLGVKVIDSVIRDIEDQKYINTASEVALCHHERWDGNGYPNHIASTDIPLSARIMAVADVYDALRSERPYKKAFTKEESANIIISESGTHFDPDVVKAFELIKDVIEE